MPLTPKQEAFALAYLETGNASEAYRRSYNAQAMKPATINRNAAALLKNSKIATRLEATQTKAAEAAVVTAAAILARAWAIAQTDAKDRVAALSVAARAFPEFKDATVIDSRSLTFNLPEGTTLEDLRKLRDGLK